MIVLHSGLLDGRFYLWGERKPAASSPAEDAPGPDPAIEPPVTAGEKRRPRQRSVPGSAVCAPHPFAAERRLLREALIQAGLRWITPARAATVAVWLPTRSGRPLSSSPLVGEEGESGAPAGPALWAVPAVSLAERDLLQLLAACAGRSPLAPGVAAGPDLHFWVGVLAFAGSMTARQRYLPGMVERGGRHLACWEPVFTGADERALESLARALPPVCRALTAPEKPEPPRLEAGGAVRAFVGAIVDHLVRSAAPGVGPNGSEVPPSLHDGWLRALTGPEPLIRWEPGELIRFRDQLAGWRRPVRGIADAPYRLCFRLEEPKLAPAPPPAAADAPAVEGSPAAQASAAGVERWTLRYLLQPREEPGLVVPLEEVWSARGKKAAIWKSAGGDVREYLFFALGQAAGIYPALTSSLNGAEPVGLELDAEGAYEFLSRVALPLEGAGFGVLLPAGWTRRESGDRLRLRARVRGPRLQGSGGISLEELVEFQWEVALGDQTLTLKELESLAALKSPLVVVRGKWVELRAGELEAILQCLKKRSRKVSLQEAVRMALHSSAPADAPVEGLELDGVQASGWIGKLLKQLEGQSAFEELPAPEGFRGTLRPYQLRGYSWLQFLRQWGLGACLADDMGLGKTVQVLALLQADWEAGRRRPVLLVCPTSVISNWAREAGRFTPELPVLIHHGQGRARGAEFLEAAPEQALVVTSYTLLTRDLDLLRRLEWGGIILDEAQNIKNPETRQSRAARAVRAGYRYALTGTPVENSVGDLWSIMEFINPGFLGGQAEFRRRFFLPIQVYGNPAASGRLKRLVGPFILRRLKTDRSIITDLPEKVEMDVFCPLTREQAALYTAVLRRMDGTLESADGIQRKGLILSTLLRLKQICNHPAQFLRDRSSSSARSGKLTRLTEMLEEVLAEGDKALIFTQFAEMGRILKEHLEDTFAEEVMFLHGQVSRGQRDRMVERFQEEPRPPLFVLSLKAAGTGLNLTRAGHVFHFDRWWNPAVENQATDRAFRIGQKKKVLVHRLICAGTLEEKVAEMLVRKRAVAEQVIGEGEAWLTELSNQELRELLALREETVVDG